ncbi:MAG: sel1 repeat family protein, partial [Kangiellaceae bacterium]|nr:sel1 repeat family protein [Kangiellaceae bacterium]
ELMRIADAYNFEDIVDNNYDKAFNYYSKAAALGEPRGTNNTGAYYRHGISVDKNINKAVEFYEEAAALGYTDSFFNLAKIYEKGEVGEKDLGLAIEHYFKASKHGHKESRERLIDLTCYTEQSTLDVKMCLEVLDSYGNDDKKVVYRELYKLIFSKNLDDEINQWGRSFYQQNGYELHIEQKNIKIEEEGLYRRQSRGIQYLHDNSGSELEVDSKSAIGVKIRLVGDVKQSDKYLLKASLIPPVSISAQDKAILEQEDKFKFVQFEGADTSQVLFKFRSFKMKHDGKWRLKIENVRGDLLYDREYDISVDW